MDPNVLISAAISGKGVPRELLNRWKLGKFDLIVSAEVLFELQEVLDRTKFRRYLTETEAIQCVLWIHDGAVEVSEELPVELVSGTTGDLDDDYLVGVALLGDADVIVSGDRHLLNLVAIRDRLGNVIARVLSPMQFLEELSQSG